MVQWTSQYLGLSTVVMPIVVGALVVVVYRSVGWLGGGGVGGGDGKGGGSSAVGGGDGVPRPGRLSEDSVCH